MSHDATENAPSNPPVSVLAKRLRKFRSLKRGYYSFLILSALYVLSFFLFLIINDRAIIVQYKGKTYYPAFSNLFFKASDFDQNGEFFIFGDGPVNFRLLQARCASEGKGDWVLMPIIPYNAYENAPIFKEREILAKYAKQDFSADLPPPPPKDGDDEGNDDGDDEEMGMDEDDENYTDDEGDEGDDDPYAEADPELYAKIAPPFPPSKEHWLGTDDRGRDLIARLAYGFNISITFALILCIVSYFVGVSVGAVLGYYGSWADLLGQRLIEVWQTVPFLFTVMILGSALANLNVLDYRQGLADILQPRFIMLVVVLAAFSWMGITFYIRGEFLREKAKDYVSAAISIGTPDLTIIFKHVLPNALTPVVTFAPFTIVGNIGALVALDYLGFGLPPPTPSWGELLKQITSEINTAPWALLLSPILALFFTLLLVVFIGEAVREAFDPKVFSRLR